MRRERDDPGPVHRDRNDRFRLEAGIADQHRGEARSDLGRREIVGKIVLVCDCRKGGANDPPALRGVRRLKFA
jgi:hypothetical protein